MASGTEMMMASLFKAMGFNPQVFVKQIEGFLGFVQGEMVKFTETSKRIETKQVEIDAKLDLILSLLKPKEYLNGRHGKQNAIEYAGQIGDGATEHTGAVGGSGGNKPD